MVNTVICKRVLINVHLNAQQDTAHILTVIKVFFTMDYLTISVEDLAQELKMTVELILVLLHIILQVTDVQVHGFQMLGGKIIVPRTIIEMLVLFQHITLILDLMQQIGIDVQTH